MKSLVFCLINGIAGLWLAQYFIEGVEIQGSITVLLICGAILGLANFFLKPIFNILTLPLRILSGPLTSILVNMIMVWLADIIFPELVIPGILPLFWTGMILWGLNFITSFFVDKKNFS